jgi:transcriptional regulator with XRE-family HTH domain
MEHESFREHLLRAIRRLGIEGNLAEVARRTGVNYHTLRDLLVRRPEKEISVETARQIAEGLGFSVDTGLPTSPPQEVADLVATYEQLPEEFRLRLLEDARILRLASGIGEPAAAAQSERPPKDQ